jgi:hypothetical protein
MPRIARSCLLCITAAASVALAGCSAQLRHGMLDGGYASPCGAAFIGYHGPIERCFEE